MVLAYLQSVLLCRDFGLLRHDGHFPRRSSHFWCQAASHLDGRWDLVNVLRIVLWRGGKRCCRVLHRKNGCSNRREYMAAGTFLNEKPFENCLFFWPLPSLVCLRQTFLAWAFYKVFESDVWERLEERRNKVRQEKIVLWKQQLGFAFRFVCLLIYEHMANKIICPNYILGKIQFQLQSGIESHSVWKTLRIFRECFQTLLGKCKLNLYTQSKHELHT